MTTLLSLYIPGCIGAVAATGNAKWSLRAGTRDNFEPTLVVAGRVRGVVAGRVRGVVAGRVRGVVAEEEGYEQYKFHRCQAKLVINKRWLLTRVVVQEGDYCIMFVNCQFLFGHSCIL